MKKIYFLTGIFVLGLSLLSTAQQRVNSVKSAQLKSNSQFVAKDSDNLRSIPGVEQFTPKSLPFYSEDFTLPTTWVTTGTGPAGTDWNVNATGGLIPAAYKFGASQGSYAWIRTSTIAGAYNRSITSPTIDCSGHPNIRLSFKQIYARYFDVPKLQISIDGGVTFTDFALTANSSIARNTALGTTALPDVQKIDISAVAGNQADVKIRFNMDGNNDYWWCVDDVTLTDISQFDMTAGKIFFTNEYAVGYSKTPLSQVDKIAFAVEAQNSGFSDQDITVTTNITGPVTATRFATYSGFPAGVMDTVYSTSIQGADRWEPTATGTYTVEMNVSTTNIDGNPGDNSTFSSFQVTDSVYAREYGKCDETLGGINGTDVSFADRFPYIIGSKYQIVTDTKVKSVSFAVSSVAAESVVGAKLRVRLMRFNSGWTTEAMSDVYTLKATDRPSSNANINKFITLTLPETDLIAGEEYVAAVERLVETPADSSKIALILCASNSVNSFSTFADGSTIGWDTSVLIFAFEEASPTPDALPYAWSETSAAIRLNIAAGCLGMAVSGTSVQPTCNLSNGSISVSVIGGDAPYSYAWSPVAVATNATTATGLGAGTYNVTVADRFGCSKVLTATLTNVGASTSATTSFTQTASCAATDGTATVIYGSGPAITSYAWSNGQTDVTATGLVGGAYVVTYTNASNCKATKSITVTQAGAPALTLTASTVSPIKCFGGNGSVQLALTGGAPAYPVSFSFGANNLSASAPITFTNIAANTYVISAQDANGCTFNGVNFSFTQPTLFVNGSATKTNVNCFGDATGTITVSSVTGGTLPYSYIWGGTATGTNTTGNIASLVAGTYTVTVKDANNCAATGPAIASQVITQPATPLSLSTESLLTGTRRVKLTINGGVAPYTISSTGASVSPSTAATSGDAIVSLSLGGDRTIRVTDANGCFIDELAASVGVTEINSVNNLAVYPNPTENNVTISFNSTEAKNVTVKLVSLNGQEIFTQQLPQFVGEYSKTVNLSAQAQGVYFLQIVSDKNVTTKKVVKL